MIECLIQGLLSSHWNIYHSTTAYFLSHPVYSTLMCGLRIFAGPSICHLNQVTLYLRLLALSILTCGPNISFLAGLVSDNSKSLEKFELGDCLPQPPVKKNFLQRVCVLVHGYLRIWFNLPSSINFWDIDGSPNWGPITLIRGHPKRYRVVPLNFVDMIFFINH